MSKKSSNDSMTQNVGNNSETTRMSICNVCLQLDYNNNLVKPCDCGEGQGFVHIKCLQLLIENTRSDRCLQCKSKYSGVKIVRHGQSFYQFLRKNPGEVSGFIAATLVFSFFYYIIFLGVIDYIISKDIIDNVLRIILIVPTIIFGVLITLILFGYICSVCYRYHKWRRNNLSITVKIEENNQTKLNTNKISNSPKENRSKLDNKRGTEVFKQTSKNESNSDERMLNVKSKEIDINKDRLKENP